MSYFKLLGYNVSKKLTGSANSLFSTAVISGSSSAPNLKDMVPPHASAVAAIEGFGGVPPIRPLETLHNALSLRQLDSFLDMMTSVPLFRTPASSPPKHPSPASSTHESLNPTLGHPGISREYHTSDTEAVRYITPTPIQYKSLGEVEACDRGNLPSPTSPNSTGWSSEPQSFLSSEPSSPAPTSTGECSMSISLISNDGNEDGQIRKITQIPQAMQQVAAAAAAAAGNSSQSKTTVCDDDLPADNVDEDEDHTLTLRQNEEQKKQDVKLIFEQRDNVNSAKVSGGCKKIGRFRVESTDLTQGDVRIKETDNSTAVAAVSEKGKPSTPQKSDSPKSTAADKLMRKDSKKGSQHSSQKRRNFSRSQSVTAPKPAGTKPAEPSFSYKCMSTKQGSLSTMSATDLENWKLSVLNPTNTTQTTSQQDEPILTVAASISDNSNITVGFDVKEEKKE